MATTQPQTNRIKIANPSIENNVRSYLIADTAVSVEGLAIFMRFV